MVGTILLVEDDKLMRDSFVLTFAEEADHVVVTYSSGDEAVESIRDGLMYDVLVVNRELPDSGGDYVTRVSKDIRPEVPVVGWSVYDFHSEYLDHFVLKGRNCFENMENLLERILKKKDSTKRK